jgi:hypothetical protein
MRDPMKQAKASRRKMAGRIATLPLAALLLGGCVQVSAPDKPIEIVLTINIRQEIVYRLDGETRELIEQNSEIF